MNIHMGDPKVKVLQMYEGIYKQIIICHILVLLSECIGCFVGEIRLVIQAQWASCSINYTCHSNNKNAYINTSGFQFYLIL